MSLKPLEQMTVKELEGRIRFHEGLADHMYVMRETGDAARIRDLASIYRNELNKKLDLPQPREKLCE